MSTESPGEGFGAEYYRRVFGLDELRRFNMHWWSVRFYALLAQRLLRRGGGRRVFEVGCAHGYTLARLERRFETFGIDISEYAIERARTTAPRSRVWSADIAGPLPQEIERGGFDLVLAKYVLEHLPRPADALRRIAGLLAPGGALLYSVPDTTSPGRRLKRDQWFALKDETHVSLLEPSAWLELTRGAGLTVERVFSDGLWDVPYVRGVPRLLQFGMFSVPTMVSVLFAAPIIPAGWGENLIVIARAGVRP
ncbi:MAG: class I SAM-dependent methyltransferase [Acidobacteria bacterium]|nr:class I SAM-dependent methyltransferase [Acidobacteriota bacterium]